MKCHVALFLVVLLASSQVLGQEEVDQTTESADAGEIQLSTLPSSFSPIDESTISGVSTVTASPGSTGISTDAESFEPSSTTLTSTQSPVSTTVAEVTSTPSPASTTVAEVMSTPSPIPTTVAEVTSTPSPIPIIASAVTSTPTPVSTTSTTLRQSTTPVSFSTTPEIVQKTPNATTARQTTTRATTARPTTPRPVPTPPEFPQNEGNWSVVGIQSSCILLKGAFQIHLKRSNIPELVLNVPNTLIGVDVGGDCRADNQHLNLNWLSRNESEGTTLNNTLRFIFSKEADGQYGLSSVKYGFIQTSVVNASSNINGSAETTGPFFLTSLQRSFICNSMQRIEKDDASLYLFTENVQFEAFRNDDTPSSNNFSEAEECSADYRNSTGFILGVAVAIGLGIVVCIALATYLIKRCRRDGYQPLDEHS